MFGEVQGCLLELHVPQYPSLARQARLVGTAAVELTVGDRGDATAISIKGVDRLLEEAAKEAVRSSRFAESCRSQSIRFTFIFELQEPPKQRDSSQVLFRPPNVFVIRASYFPLSGQSAYRTKG